MKYFLLCLFVGSFVTGRAQTDNLPVKVLASKVPGKPIIFYSTGDGGWTKFSNALVQSFNQAGYPVIALNSREYFWKQKTPAQTAADVSSLLNKYLAAWKRDSVVLVGYSFGADVTPFIQNNLDKDLSGKTTHIVLMLPYRSTDFEVHLTEMIGISGKDAYSVPDEINKLNKPILFVLGTERNQFPLNSLRIRNYHSITIDGGHHFDDNADKVAGSVLASIVK
jgi:type IV secretory pathway VirJ component